MQERLISSYDPFVIPYTFGLIFVLTYLFIAFFRVMKALPYDDKIKFWKHVLIPWKFFKSLKEIFMESLMHRKIWKKNWTLGYMHTAFAFGWFLLIILGHFEVQLFAPHRLNLPWYPIFFRYFMMETETTMQGSFFFFMMDLALLYVLSGLALAIYKRFRRKAFGMKRTTKLRWNDQIAVYSLWAIFPLRFLAESFYSEISGGSFLTAGIGSIFHWFGNFTENEIYVRPIWWAYSVSLGMFFIMLPWSRFTHILTEPLFIVLRNAGIREEHRNSGYGKVEIYSCSRCGICLDPCQLVSTASLRDSATINYTRHLRLWKSAKAHQAASQCLMCNRCTQACPVGVNSVALKLNTKHELINLHTKNQYDYLNTSLNDKDVILSEAGDLDVIYFAGCMTHLTPAIKLAMTKILETSGERFLFVDAEGSICCGRPVLLAGARKSAKVLMEKNTELFEQTNAKILVTSCPICYKFFNENYTLNMRVLHHSQYIYELLKNGKIKSKIINQKSKIVFHDPCELGRNSGIYDEPREILKSVGQLQSTAYDGKESLCCGHSIAAEALPYQKRRVMAKDAVEKLTASQPDVLATACPACKKAFSETNKIDVKDLAEIIAENLCSE
ncbi:MAG: (Fe-S)-binding protein [Bacteroidales bacterium]|jgi:Fe-S oxidoreductase|nr:(Fe-S)-binding protein [Bacteroidales bacterium]